MPDHTNKQFMTTATVFFQRVRMPFPTDLANINDVEATTNFQHAYKLIPGRVVTVYIYIDSAWVNQGISPTRVLEQREFWEPVEFFDPIYGEWMLEISGHSQLGIKTVEPRAANVRDNIENLVQFKFIDDNKVAPKYYGGINYQSPVTTVAADVAERDGDRSMVVNGFFDQGVAGQKIEEIVAG